MINLCIRIRAKEITALVPPPVHYHTYRHFSLLRLTSKFLLKTQHDETTAY
jgi:hypothetical protein